MEKSEDNSKLNNLTLRLLSYLSKSNKNELKLETAMIPSLQLSIELQKYNQSINKPEKAQNRPIKLSEYYRNRTLVRWKPMQRLSTTSTTTPNILSHSYLYERSNKLKMPVNNQYYDPSPSAPSLPNFVPYKNSNELCSIFISMLTAAVFLLFIMWRWIRIKSDLRQAMREQSEIEREMRLNGGESSSLPSSSPLSTSLACTSNRFDTNAFRFNP